MDELVPEILRRLEEIRADMAAQHLNGRRPYKKLVELIGYIEGVTAHL